MSDHEMRALLRQVMDDLEKGRIAQKRLPRSRLGRLLAPPLLAASLGLAGCSDTSVGSTSDATAQDASADVGPFVDAAYMAPFDAAVDSGPQPPYMAPPYDAGPQPDYMSPFDGSVEEDAGSVPLYMGPPPLPDNDGDHEEDEE
ncbi:MAG: hypothetical protein ABI333_23170 [bacterium]